MVGVEICFCSSADISTNAGVGRNNTLLSCKAPKNAT